MKRIFFVVLSLSILLSSTTKISQNSINEAFLPNGRICEFSYFSTDHTYKNALILYRTGYPSSSKLLEIDTGNSINGAQFTYGTPFVNKSICLVDKNNYLLKQNESEKVLSGSIEKFFLDDKGSYLYSKVISEIFEDDALKHGYLHKIVVCPYNAKSWVLEQYSHNRYVSYSEFIIINDKLLSLFQREKLEVYNALNGSLIMSIDEFEDYPRFFEQNKNYLFLGKHLFHLNPFEVVAKIERQGECTGVKLEDKRLIVCSLIDNQYQISIFDLEGKLISIKGIDVFFKNKSTNPEFDHYFYKKCAGIGKDCIVVRNEDDLIFEIWSIENKLLDVIKINWVFGDSSASFESVVGDKFILPLSTAIICYDTATLKVIWTKPMASRVNVVDNRWINYFQRTSIDSGTSVILMDIFNQDRKITIPTKAINNYWLDYNNDILMFDRNFEKNSKWPAKVTPSGMEYPYKVQYSGETVYPFMLGNSLFCVYLDSVSNKLRLLNMNVKSWKIVQNYSANIESHAKDNDKFALLTKDNYINLYLMANENSPYNMNRNKDYIGNFKVDSIYSKLFFWKSKYIVAYSTNTVQVFDYYGESIYTSNVNEFLGHDEDFLFFCNSNNFVSFDGTREITVNNPFKELKYEHCQFARNGKVYTKRECIDPLTGEFYQHIFLSDFERQKWKFVKSSDDFYVWNFDYWNYPSPVKYSPCNTFSIQKQLIGNNIEVTIKNTTSKNLNNPLSGIIRIMPYGTDGKAPIFYEFDKQTYSIPPLNSGESATMRIPLPEMKTLDDQLNLIGTDYFALVIESNGLLDTKNSELSNFDKEGRPLFDGVPISLEKQQAIVVTVWEKE